METNFKPVALILAGYNRVSKRLRRKMINEIKANYDGDEIYMGENKFLHELAGKPIIQYVLDAVYNARKSGKRLYDKIYIYNDIKSFNQQINASKYLNLELKQMKESVGGHWKDFYFNHVEYGQQIDVFFGDTPRIMTEDVEYIHDQFVNVFKNELDYRGNKIFSIFGVVDFNDLKETWCSHRMKFIKVGRNKGKVKSFAPFEDFQVRVGNTGAYIKDKTLDGLVETESLNLLYNMRKALTPTSISKSMYYLWKLKHLKVIKQIKNRCLNYADFFNAFYDVISKLNKIDLSKFGGVMFHIKKNPARWENDIDGPKDFEIFQKKFRVKYIN